MLDNFRASKKIMARSLKSEAGICAGYTRLRFTERKSKWRPLQTPAQCVHQTHLGVPYFAPNTHTRDKVLQITNEAFKALSDASMLVSPCEPRASTGTVDTSRSGGHPASWRFQAVPRRDPDVTYYGVGGAEAGQRCSPTPRPCRHRHPPNSAPFEPSPTPFASTVAYHNDRTTPLEDLISAQRHHITEHDPLSIDILRTLVFKHLTP